MNKILRKVMEGITEQQEVGGGYELRDKELDQLAAALPILEAALDWAEDTGMCHFCERNDSYRTTQEHGRECPIYEYEHAESNHG